MPASAGAHGGRQKKRTVLGSPLTLREVELLTVTLEVLRETGYDKFTVDQVAARAHASKTTVYRRWPSKAELVCAAFASLIQREQGLPADSGSLRQDLLRLAEIIASDADEYGRTIAGILAAGERSPQLRELLVDDLQQARKDQFRAVLNRAVTRGEIGSEVISEDIWDVLPAYIMFLVLRHGGPVPAGALQAFVDEVLIPSLTRLPA